MLTADEANCCYADAGSNPYWNSTFMFKIDKSCQEIGIKIYCHNTLAADDELAYTRYAVYNKWFAQLSTELNFYKDSSLQKCDRRFLTTTNTCINRWTLEFSQWFSPNWFIESLSFLVCLFFGGVIGFMAAVYRSGRYSLRAILCPFKVSMCCALLAKSEARSECLSHSSVILWCEPPSASKNLKDFGTRS